MVRTSHSSPAMPQADPAVRRGALPMRSASRPACGATRNETTGPTEYASPVSSADHPQTSWMKDGSGTSSVKKPDCEEQRAEVAEHERTDAKQVEVEQWRGVAPAAPCECGHQQRSGCETGDGGRGCPSPCLTLDDSEDDGAHPQRRQGHTDHVRPGRGRLCHALRQDSCADHQGGQGHGHVDIEHGPPAEGFDEYCAQGRSDRGGQTTHGPPGTDGCLMAAPGERIEQQGQPGRILHRAAHRLQGPRRDEHPDAG